MSEPDPSAWLESIAEILDDEQIDWALIGALAANRYRSTVRFTTDLDVMAQAHAGLPERLRAAGYAVEVIADAGDPPHMLRCHRGAEQVDILYPVVEYQQIALDRSVDHVLTAEDVIIHKLIAWRLRDRDDIRSIIEAGSPLDLAYIDRWANEWDVADRWAGFSADDVG